MTARLMCWLFGHKPYFAHPQQMICYCRRCDGIVRRRLEDLSHGEGR